MSMWNWIAYGSWGLSSILVLWMIYDWIRTDRAFSEAQLTSSREGDIEALSEKHKL